MIRRLAEGMGIRAREGARTGRLFTFIFFVTAAAVLSKSAQRDVFLSAYPRSALPDAFLFSALLMAAASLVISMAAVRLGLVRLMQTLLLGAAALFALGWVALQVGHPAAPMGLYVAVEGLISLLLVQGWAVAAEAVDVRAAKRLLPVVGIGAGVAWTFGGLAVGGLAQWAGPQALLLTAAGSLCLGSVTLSWVSRKDIERSTEPVRAGSTLAGNLVEGLRYITQEPLMRVMALVITIELVVERVMDFQLLSAAQVHFGAQPGAIASFMGLFYGVTGAITLVAPFTFSGKALARFGSTRMLLAGQAAVVVGSLVFFAWPAFVAIVGLSAVDRILKQALTGPARSQVFGVIPSVRRAQAGALLRGVVAAVFSALAALMLKGLPASVPIHYLALPAAALTLVLLWVTRRDLHKTYLLALQNSVDRRKLDLDDDGPGARLQELDREHVAMLEEELRAADPDRAQLAISIAAAAPGPGARRILTAALSHPNPEVRAHGATTLAKLGDVADVPLLCRTLEQAPDEPLRLACLRALADLQAIEARPTVRRFLRAQEPKVRALAFACHVTLDRLAKGGEEAALGFAALLVSPVAEEREAAAWALGQVPLEHPGVRESFLPLLADRSMAVRRAALASSGHYADPQVVRALVFALEEPSTAAAAFEAIPKLPDPAVAGLELLLRDAPTQLVSRAASALSLAGSVHATELLNTLLEHADAQVRYRASRALALRRRAAQWIPDEVRLLKAVRQELEQGYRYQATLIALAGSLRVQDADDPERRFIAGEIDSRIQQTEQRLLALIALIADPRIARLSHHLREASPQVTARVLELLEESLDATIAQVVVPFLERQPKEGSGRAELGEVADPVDALLSLNDPHLSRCALLVYRETIAGRHPDLVTAEAHLLHLVERIRFLRNVPLFKGLSPEDLMKLAEIAEPVQYVSGQLIFSKGDPGDVMCVVARGRVEIRSQGVLIATQGPNDFFGELAIFDQEARSADAFCAEDTELLEIGGADLEALMERRPEIAREVIRVLARRLRKTTQEMIGRTQSDPGNVPIPAQKSA
jgi:HEAT repeat protein